MMTITIPLVVRLSAFGGRRQQNAARMEQRSSYQLLNRYRTSSMILVRSLKGARVFPDILKGAETAEDRHRRIQQENQNVRKRLHMICKDILGWEERISGTWARHSFATNLRNAGVDMQYISESMGHSTLKTVTQLYLASYPLHKQFEYNKRLLRLEDEPTIDDIPNMTKEQMQALLIKMMSNK